MGECVLSRVGLSQKRAQTLSPSSFCRAVFLTHDPLSPKPAWSARSFDKEQSSAFTLRLPIQSDECLPTGQASRTPKGSTDTISLCSRVSCALLDPTYHVLPFVPGSLG